MSQEPREFWIYKNSELQQVIDWGDDTSIYVIEKRALDTLKAELAQCRAELVISQKMFEDARKTAEQHSQELTYRGSELAAAREDYKGAMNCCEAVVTLTEERDQLRAELATEREITQEARDRAIKLEAERDSLHEKVQDAELAMHQISHVKKLAEENAALKAEVSRLQEIPRVHHLRKAQQERDQLKASNIEMMQKGIKANLQRDAWRSECARLEAALMQINDLNQKLDLPVGTYQKWCELARAAIANHAEFKEKMKCDPPKPQISCAQLDAEDARGRK